MMSQVNMPMADRYIGNKWFLLLFLVWVVVGGTLVAVEQDRFFFRWVNLHHTALWDQIMPALTLLGEGAVVVTVLLLLFLKRGFRNLRFAALLLLCNGLPFLLTQALKNIFALPRPLSYFREASWIHQLPGQPRLYHLSFPSGHTEGVFALCCFLSFLLPRRWAGWGVLLFFIALATGYSRMYLGHHFLADVYGGSLIGVGCVWICYYFFCIFTDPFNFNKKHLRNV